MVATPFAADTPLAVTGLVASFGIAGEEKLNALDAPRAAQGGAE